MKISYFFGLAAVLLAMTGCSKSNDWLVDIDYIPVKMEDSESWSLIDKDGNIVCKDEFKKRPTSVTEGMFFVYEGEGYSLYKVGDKPEEVSNCQKLKDHSFFNDGRCLVTFPGERISVIDKDGNKVATLGPINGHEVTRAYGYFGEGLIVAELDDGTCGYLNMDGKKALDFKYSDAGFFYEGLAVVVKDDKVMVINPKGETVFKVKNDIELSDDAFYHGYIWGRYESDGRVVIIDNKGNVTKCPEKVERIKAFDGDYFIFRGSDGYGLMALDETEIVIRAKYDSMEFTGGGNLLVKKDDHFLIINTNDEEQCRIDDYSSVGIAAPGFGLWAQDGNTIVRIGEDGKQLDKNVAFNDVDIDIHLSISSDYFDYDGLTKALTALINDNGVDKYRFGSNPSNYFSNPSTYSYDSSASIGEIAKTSLYEIEGEVHFDTSMTSSVFDYDTYSYDYQWNSISQLDKVTLTITAVRSISDTGVGKITDALTKKGFTVASKSDADDYKYEVTLTKGDLEIKIEAYKDSSIIHLYVKGKYDIQLPAAEEVAVAL